MMRKESSINQSASIKLRNGLNEEFTPLGLAVHHTNDNNLDFYKSYIKLLLNLGADPDQPFQKHWSPLTLAIKLDHAYDMLPIVKTLLNANADVNQASRSGRTPLHYASWTDNPEILNLLFQKGARTNARDKEGKTPLMMAARDGHKVLGKKLIAAGANVDAETDQGWTPLMYAVVKHEPDLVALLLKNDADVTIKNRSGQTPLELAREEEKDAWSNELEDFEKIIDLLRNASPTEHMWRLKHPSP